MFIFCLCTFDPKTIWVSGLSEFRITSCLLSYLSSVINCSQMVIHDRVSDKDVLACFDVSIYKPLWCGGCVIFQSKESVSIADLPDHNISSRALRAIITKWTHERSYWTSKSLWFGFSVSSIWFQVNLPVPLIESIYYVIEMSSFIWFCGIWYCACIYVIGYVNILPTENIFVCILPIKQAHSMWLSFTDHKPKQNWSSSNSTYTDKYNLSWVTPEHWLYYFQ